MVDSLLSPEDDHTKVCTYTLVVGEEFGGLLVLGLHGVQLVSGIQHEPRAVSLAVEAVEGHQLAGTFSVQLQELQLTEVRLVEELKPVNEVVVLYSDFRF